MIKLHCEEIVQVQSEKFLFQHFNSFVLQLFHFANVQIVFVPFLFVVVVLPGKRNFRNAITMIITSSLTVPAAAIRPQNGKCASYEVHTHTDRHRDTHTNIPTDSVE